MTGDDAREALTIKFLADWASAFPTMGVFVEGNDEPDLTQETAPFVMFKVGLPDVSQADLSNDPMRRYVGLVELGLFVPMGQGTKPFFDMFDVIDSKLAVQNISGIRMYSATTIERQPAVGWQSREGLVNYSFDSIN